MVLIRSPLRYDDLPGSIRGRIETYTFQRPYPVRHLHIHIDRDYRPPGYLQVDRFTRSWLAPHYYETSTFIFTGSSYEIVLQTCLRWLRSLPAEHVAMVQHIDIAINPALSRYSPLHLHQSLFAAGLPVENLCVTFGTVVVVRRAGNAPARRATVSRSRGGITWW